MLCLIAMVCLILPVDARAATAEADKPLGPAPVAPDSYLLEPGDVISITVYGHDDLHTTMRVAEDGGASFPMIGPLKLSGRDCRSVREELERRLEDGYLRRADVQIHLATPGERPYFVIGAVQKAGFYYLDPFNPRTAQQAIGMAGGLTDEAERATVVVLRADPADPVAWKALTVRTGAEGTAPGSDVVLRRGDIIAVARRDRVFVMGSVQRVGPVNLVAGEAITLSRAITQAGGFDRFAKKGAVQLIRPGEAQRTVDVESILAGKAGNDPILQPGDLVFVPESRF